MTHHPVSYKATSNQRESSLGALDNLCKRLQIFLKKFLLDIPSNSNFKDHVENLIQSFVYLINFKFPAAFTKIIPAELHLGTIRASNIQNFTASVERLQSPESLGLKRMQQCLQFSSLFQRAEKNAKLYFEQQKAKQLKVHNKLLSEDKYFETLQPLSLCYVKTELLQVPKFHLFCQYHGPFVILSILPKSKSIFLFGLLSAEVVKKSFKQVKAVLQPEIFSLPMFSHLGKEIEFRIVKKFDRLKKKESQIDIHQKITQILLNLHKLVIFLAPILPKSKETQNLINIDLSNDDEDGIGDHHDDNDDDHHYEDDDDNHGDYDPHDNGDDKDHDGHDHQNQQHHQDHQSHQPQQIVRFSNMDDQDIPQISDIGGQQTQLLRRRRDDSVGFSLPDEKPTHFHPSQSQDSDVILNRPKLPNDPPPRAHKYSLRRNRKPKKFDDFVEF